MVSHRTYVRLGVHFLLVHLWACKSETPTPQAEVVERVFTNGTEIFDQKVKARFISQLRTPFILGPLDGQGKALHLVASDTAQFQPYPNRFSFTKTGSQYLFYSAPFPHPPLTNFNTIDWRLGKYRLPLIPILFTVGEYSSREVRVGYENQGRLELAVLLYRYVQTPLGRFERAGLLFNEFNEDVIATIPAGDTLTIQSSRISLPIQ